VTRPKLAFLQLVTLGLLAGCGYDAGSDLPGVVEAVTPADAQLLIRCGGSSGLIEPPSHGCTFFTPGEGSAVTAAVAHALRGQGFEAGCPRPGEINAVREDVRVSVEVTQYGSVVASGGVANVFDVGYRPRGSQPIPTGSVALEISASRLPEGSVGFWVGRANERGRCDAPLPKPNLAANCVNWWNGVGWETGDEAIRLKAQRRVEIRPRWGIEIASCTYILRTTDGYLRVTAHFKSGDWTWPPLRRGSPPTRFQPNGRLNEDGRLDLIVTQRESRTDGG
jgi:hypothetical protein